MFTSYSHKFESLTAEILFSLNRQDHYAKRNILGFWSRTLKDLLKKEKLLTNEVGRVDAMIEVLIYVGAVFVTFVLCHVQYLGWTDMKRPK